jgi:hypothetical protein
MMLVVALILVLVSPIIETRYGNYAMLALGLAVVLAVPAVRSFLHTLTTNERQ